MRKAIRTHRTLNPSPKEIFLPPHLDFAVQYQLSRTRQPLYPVLHPNHHMRGPHASFFIFFTSPPSLSLSPTPASLPLLLRLSPGAPPPAGPSLP